MTLSEAFDNLKSARRADDGTVIGLQRIHAAAWGLMAAINEETMNRLLSQQTTEPTLPDAT